jgi:hypothetical protein
MQINAKKTAKRNQRPTDQHTDPEISATHHTKNLHQLKTFTIHGVSGATPSPLPHMPVNLLPDRK